jgi:hypothetical protein
MCHQPGIQPADVAEILAFPLDLLVLLCDILLRLQVCPEIDALIRSRGIA